MVWKNYPFIWTGIIASAQILDAIKGVFPFARLHKSAVELTVALELLYIDAEDEWESIYRGSMKDEDITKRRTKLRKLQLDAERKHFPDGFEPSQKLIALATAEASAYFALTYSQEASQ